MLRKDFDLSTEDAADEQARLTLLRSDPLEGETNLNLEAQSLVADLLYRLFPKFEVFDSLTQARLCLKDNDDRDPSTILYIDLKEPNRSNITNARLLRGIEDTLYGLYERDALAETSIFKPRVVNEKQLSLCTIRYDLMGFASVLMMESLERFPEREDILNKVGSLSAILQRLDSSKGYIPAFGLN